MAAVGFSGNSFGHGSINFPSSSNEGKKVSFEDNIRNTISRLEQERDKYKRKTSRAVPSCLIKRSAISRTG